MSQSPIAPFGSPDEPRWPVSQAAANDEPFRGSREGGELDEALRARPGTSDSNAPEVQAQRHPGGSPGPAQGESSPNWFYDPQQQMAAGWSHAKTVSPATPPPSVNLWDEVSRSQHDTRFFQGSDSTLRQSDPRYVFAVNSPTADVQGMMTAEAARRQALNGAILPPILLVEEDGGVLQPPSFVVTWLFSLLLGWLGADRFYLGQWKLGLGKLLTGGGLGVWILVDLALHLAGHSQDVFGRRLAGRQRYKILAWLVSVAVVVYVLKTTELFPWSLLL